MTVNVASAFSDPDGDGLTYGASSSASAVASVSVSGTNVAIAGVSAGTATVTVTASDPDGLSAQQTFGVTVPNRAPEATDSIPAQTIEVGDSVSFDLADHFSDPDGDALTYVASSSATGVASASVSGTVLAVEGVSAGTATVTVTASDPDGLSAEQTFDVTVPNRAPEATDSIPARTIEVGDSVSFDLANHFSDPDGDALTYVASSSAPGVASASVSGAVLAVAGVSVGTATVTVTASDPDGLSAEQAFEVTVPNRAPEATDGIPAQTIEVGDSVSFDLADHFSDPDGDALMYAASSSAPGVASVSVSGTNVAIAGVAAGTATVTVTVSDPDGLSAEQAFEVTVPNRAPEATDGIPARTIEVGDSVSFDLADHFSDPDGDALTYGASSSASAVASVSVSGTNVAIAGVSAGTATVTVTASDPEGLSAEQAFEVTVPNRAPEATDSIPARTIEVGDSVSFDLADHFSDPDGDALTYTASSSAPGVARASVSGAVLTVTGVSAGTTTVTVTASDPGGLSGNLSFQVRSRRRGQPTITGTEPGVLVEGATARITGFGFSATRSQNQVSIDGLPARVTSATTTGLSIVVPRADCLPPRTAELRVSVGREVDAETVGVTPPPEELELSIGSYRYTRPGNGCVHLPSDPDGGEYLIGVVSTSENPASLTAIDLEGIQGDAAVAAHATDAIVSADPGPASSRTASAGIPAMAARLDRTAVATDARANRFPFADHPFPVRDLKAHNEIMARNRALRLELGRQSGAAVATGQNRRHEVGDTIALFVLSHQTRAVVRLVGSHAVWVEDLSNRGERFSDSELRDLDAFYSAEVLEVHDDYFGEMSDVDGNGRVLLLMTHEVNRDRLGGFMVWNDLLPRSQYGTSNHAEIIYLPVPNQDATLGMVWSREELLDWYPIAIAHETTHVIQSAEEMFGEAGPKTGWELEGGARLAEQLVAYRLFGHSSGKELGAAQYSAGRYWYWNAWAFEMALFFGWDPEKGRTGRVRYAPEQCSWVGLSWEGNSGPCKHPDRAIYGMPSMVLRFAMDRWGGRYPGGERALARRLTQSPEHGFASLEDVSKWRIEQILAEFYATLWLDLRGYMPRGMTTWNLQDVFSQFPSGRQLRPYVSTSVEPRLGARVRAGSSLYLHWKPTGTLDPTSIKVTSRGGGPIANHLAVWALRVR